MMHGQPMQETTVVIRTATSEDAPLLRPLVEELGYLADPTADRLRRVLDATGHRVLVAETPNGEIIGWVHVFGTVRVESEPFAEIGGLVVARTFRGCGVGRRLVTAAERWAQGNDFHTVRIRSRTERADAHRFFELRGYSVCKTQRVFERSLAEEPR